MLLSLSENHSSYFVYIVCMNLLFAIIIIILSLFKIIIIINDNKVNCKQQLNNFFLLNTFNKEVP